MNIEISQHIEQEFAYVDSIITAHTNAAIAKVNAESLQTYWEVGGFISHHLKTSEWGDHVVNELADYLKRKNPKRRGYSKRNLYNMVRFFDTYSSPDWTMSPTMEAEYKRILMPREVMKKSLVEYCEFLKKQYE